MRSRGSSPAGGVAAWQALVLAAECLRQGDASRVAALLDEALSRARAGG